MISSDEQDLLEELRRLYSDYERLNRKIQLATQRQQFSSDSKEIKRAVADERKWLTEINRLMDRMRSLEGHLLRARGKIRPLTQ